MARQRLTTSLRMLDAAVKVDKNACEKDDGIFNDELPQCTRRCGESKFVAQGGRERRYMAIVSDSGLDQKIMGG